MNNFFSKISANFKHDFPAAIVVFLVALPLCLGIALASDAPLFSGIITGVIGGMVVALLSGSELSISGPAAGLTVIVATSIHQLHTFENFLLAVALSGVVQIILGFLRAGSLASLFPNSVIKGMLAAIGITIILKQLPYALGGYDSFESDMTFLSWIRPQGLLSQILGSAFSAKISAVLITIGSLGLILVWETDTVKKQPVLSKIPGALAAVCFGALMNQLFHANFPSLALHADDGHLVQLPEISSLSALLAELRTPNFAAISNPLIWTIALTIAAVGSIETLLCIESTDKIDPLKRVSNTNRELRAQGVGNLLCGLIGGIPLTSVIVRSSANIYAGGRTRVSGFLHGLILLVSVLSLYWILNLIPLASLAAILLSVGFKLAHPSLWKKMWHAGRDQFVPFAITIIAIISTDLLKGVAVGVLVGLGFVIRTTYTSAMTVVSEGQDVLIKFTKDVTFIHKMRLRKELATVPNNSALLVDGSRTLFIDHDIVEMLQEFSVQAGAKNIRVELRDVANKDYRKKHAA